MVSAFYNSDHSSPQSAAKTAADSRPGRLSRSEQNDLITWVQVWHDAGCAVHPSKTDGSKYAVAVKHGSPDLQPDVFPDTYPSGKFAGMPHPRAGQQNPEAGQHDYGWGRIKDGDMAPLTVDQIAAYIRAGRADGIGIICGRVSGGVFMLEAEGRARDLLPKVREAADRLGHLHLLERLAAGCVDESPSGGLHFYLRSEDGAVPGNTLLAARPADHGRDVLFETRGQGGWSVVAPSAGRTHKTGKPYRFVRGGPSTIPTFTAAEIEFIFDVFRAVDEMPVQPVVERQPAKTITPTTDDGLKPGDDYNQRASWDEILHGWKRCQTVGDRTHWIRPGKAHGTSATTTADVLCCFSSSAGLPVFEKSPAGSKNALSKFAAYAHLNHGGDFAAAARDLWSRGYGSRGHDGGGPDSGAAVPVEPRPAPSGECRSLDDWRTEAAARRVAAIGQPGLHMDNSPTGSGKTHATIEALRTASSSLTVLPTHVNVVERVREMQAHGIEAVPFPELTPDTCQQFEVASHAQSLGLVAGSAVCPSCKFKDTCAYRAGVSEALSASHRVGTHERLRRSSKVAVGVEVVVIDESPESVVAPEVHISVKQITPVETLANAIQNHWYSRADPQQKAFARAMQAVVAAIHAACAGITTAGCVSVDLSATQSVPKRWQRLLMDSIRQVGVGRDLDAEALTLVTRAAAGELTSLQIVTDLTRKGRLVHFVVGSWRAFIPNHVSVIMLDATGDADDIAAVVGQPVNNCTPAGHLPLHHPVVQIPDDISRGTSSATVAGYVEAWLAEHPEVQVGIIGHQQHIRDLIDGGLLSGPARDRVAKWCYFGQGPDRASNDWHKECDHLLRLGTPRANPGDYRRWLVQHGLTEAASKIDGDWTRKDWAAMTVDGQPITVQGAGYRDPDWHRAYVAVSRSTGTQSDGRGRPILPEGIPVTILSNEPSPYPIAPSLTPQPAAVRETVEIVRKMGKPVATTLLGQTAKSPIGNLYRGNCGLGLRPTSECVQAIMAAAGVDRRAAETRLRQCKNAGLLSNPSHGWWGLPGAVDAPVTDAPLPSPEPAVAPAVTPPAIMQQSVQSVVIAATGPVSAAPAVDVVAACIPATTTATCTSTVKPADAPDFDDLLALIDERAAIMEFDGGLDRETADRLAREMVLGRDAPMPSSEPADDIVVAADHTGMVLRGEPAVGRLLQRFPGTVKPIDDHDDPFAGQRQQQQPRRPGVCSCGHDDWVQVSIHGGQSVRVDCRHCDRFGWFGVWYGRRMPAPADDRAADPPKTKVSRFPASFLPAIAADPVLAGI